MFDVSVVIAAKNEQTYVRSALESVLDQKGLSFEVVIVDDHSDDNMLAIVKDISKEYSNLVVRTNPGKGKVAAFNHGVELARGRSIVLFAGDDIMPTGSLAARYAALSAQRDDEPVVLLCRLRTISDDPSQHGAVVPKNENRGTISGASIMWNREALKSFFPVPSPLPNEDTWLEVVSTFHPDLKIMHSSVIGCDWRVHAGNSMNLLMPFDVFAPRYTARMKAYSIFRERFGSLLPEDRRRLLDRTLECEAARASGSVFRVLFSGAPLKTKLRALAYTNPFFYGLRQRSYKLFTGL